MITQQSLKKIFVYDPDTGVLRNRIARANNVIPGSVVGNLTSNGYLRTKVFRKKYLIHRLVWMYVHGAWPKGLVDHINGDKQDNRICNLRECSKSENSCNSKFYANNRSGVKGVSWSKARQLWKAVVAKDKTKYCLGFYASIDDAKAVVLKARKELHGEFARAA